MNKKLLFAAMSLAALTACTNDDFDSQNVAEKVSPIQFEVINNAETRAAMGGANGNTLVWNAEDNDLFTLYHGAADGAVKGFENAIYKAHADAAGATLTTPSMIKQGRAIMVWPVDTTFRITAGDNLTITIPDVQIPNETHKDIADIIPYVSDLVNIGAYDAVNGYSETKPVGHPSAYNTAGYSRKYPVYMRPMASQLTLKAEYGETENKLKELYKDGADGLTGDDAIEPITVTSVSLLTDDAGATKFTKTIPVKWTAPGDVNTAGTIAYQWAHATGKNEHNAWEKVTDFDIDNIATAGSGGEQVATLTSKCLVGNESSKFLILPQATITAGDPVEKGAIEVETYYGKVLIAATADYVAAGYPEDFRYSSTEYNNAWYRYVSAAQDANPNENASTPGTGDFAGKHKVVAKSTALGMAQTLNSFSTHVAGSGLTKGEPCGYSLTRYLNVNLSKLNMTGLHIKDDKQLRDVARVWKKLNLGAVTVYLDGGQKNNPAGVFTMTQHTIQVINEINGAGLNFKVKPCVDAGEECETIVITGGGDIQNIAFITNNGATQANVELDNETTAWKWNGSVKIGDGVAMITNKGTLSNATGAILKLLDKDGNDVADPIKLVNDNKWNITGGVVKVQFDVTNNGTVEISSGAEYREDGAGHIFINESTDLPSRYGGDDKKVGTVINKGVFATVDNGVINNYGLIKHDDPAAKTYITANQTLHSDGFTNDADFAELFNEATSAAGNKMGMINLPWENKNEDNISVSAALAQGFVAVTVERATAAALDASSVGTKVNYVIVKSGVTEIEAVSAQVKYLEIDQTGTEVAWNVDDPTEYVGLIVLSDVNIKLGTNINVTKGVFLADDATMYVGGTFTIDGAAPTNPGFKTYYGDTKDNFTTNYVTF